LPPCPNIGSRAEDWREASYTVNLLRPIWGNLTTVEADITEEDIETEDIETEDIETEDALQSSPGPLLIITMVATASGCRLPSSTVQSGRRGRDCH